MNILACCTSNHIQLPPPSSKSPEKPELKLAVDNPIGDALREMGYGQDLFETALQGEVTATKAMKKAANQAEYNEALENWKTSRTLLNAALGTGEPPRTKFINGVRTLVDSNGFPFINRWPSLLTRFHQCGVFQTCQGYLERVQEMLFHGIGLTRDAEDNEVGTQIIRSVMKVPGMNVNTIKEDDGTPLLPLVAQEKLYSAVRTFATIPGINVNEAGPDGITALHWVPESNGNLQTIQALLEAKADPNKADRNGQTPLHWAAIAGNPYDLQALLDGGADPNRANRNGHTPLYIAVANKNSDAVQALLDTGADPNHADLKRQTPLHWAASEGNLDILRALLNANAAPNKKDHQGRTPISCACDQEAKRLLKHANPSFTQRVKKHLQSPSFLG